jgi:hypothetical protein
LRSCATCQQTGEEYYEILFSHLSVIIEEKQTGQINLCT